MKTKSVGLIGVGLLGSALANRLLNSGLSVHGFDTSEGQLEALSRSGGIACDSAAEVVQSCDVLFLSLPSSDEVLSLTRHLRTDFKPSQIVVDTTTGDPQQVVAVGKSLAELGVSYLETTVAGSIHSSLDDHRSAILTKARTREDAKSDAAPATTATCLTTNGSASASIAKIFSNSSGRLFDK